MKLWPFLYRVPIIAAGVAVQVPASIVTIPAGIFVAIKTWQPSGSGAFGSVLLGGGIALAPIGIAVTIAGEIDKAFGVKPLGELEK